MRQEDPKFRVILNCRTTVRANLGYVKPSFKKRGGGKEKGWREGKEGKNRFKVLSSERTGPSQLERA